MLRSFIVITVSGILFMTLSFLHDIYDKSQTRHFIKQILGYQSMAHSFYHKHSYLAGDFPNASTVLGSCAKNGDANKFLNITPEIPVKPPLEIGDEISGFWHHLSLSGMFEKHGVDEKYFGENKVILGRNFPFIHGMTDAGILVYSTDENMKRDRKFHGKKIFFHAGLVETLTSEIKTKNVFSPSFASEVDVKIDDAIAHDGLVRAYGGERLEMKPSIKCVGENGLYVRSDNESKSCQLRILIN